MRNRWFDDLKVGDYVNTTSHLYQVTKVSSYYLDLIEVTGSELNPVGNEIKASIKTGKIVNSKTYISILDGDPVEFLVKVQARRDKKQAERDDRKFRWLAKKAIVREMAGIVIGPSGMVGDLLKATFFNQKGELGEILFTTEPEEIMDFEVTPWESYDGVRLDRVVAWVPERMGDESKYRFSLPSVTRGRDAYEALVELIAGTYWG